MAANPAVQRSGRDRRLYTWFAILMPIIVLMGFARTYYLKGFFDTPVIPGLLVHLHGAVMTSWVILFMVQVWLVSSRRVRVHQRLGKIGAGLAILVVLVGVTTGIASAARGATPGLPPLQFLVIPLGDMLFSQTSDTTEIECGSDEERKQQGCGSEPAYACDRSHPV